MKKVLLTIWIPTLRILFSIPPSLPDTSISYMMSQANTVSCREKNKKLLEEVENAQLAAHRCMIRDVAVKVPEPEDFIAEFIFPSHIIVPRCSGLCLDQPGGTCLPKRQPKVISHQVVLYNANGTQTCRHVELEHHRSPCRCACLLTSADCTPAQMFDSSKCTCNCDKSHNAAKYFCAQDPRRFWDDIQCSCTCKISCLPGQELDPSSCSCLSSSSTICSITPVSLSGAHPAKVATYIGLGALTVLGLTIAVTLYYIVVRKPIYSDLASFSSHNASTLSRASYKITINQSHTALDDTDRTLIDEEKTKF